MQSLLGGKEEWESEREEVSEPTKKRYNIRVSHTCHTHAHTLHTLSENDSNTHVVFALQSYDNKDVITAIPPLSTA